ncbi:MAG: CRISPR-associated protein Cas4 [Kiritimatiellae bacterium]|nr:CRISPR-associated protein Cas4 [Kiritimatiellia bacterium]
MTFQPYSVSVSLLRQFCFCPRIPYFHMVAKINPATPLWVQQGIDHHARIERLMRRRTLSRFGISHAETCFNVKLVSERYALHGTADMILVGEDQVIPVEFKERMPNSQRGVITQLMAYGLLAEEQFGKPFRRAIVLLGENGKIITFENEKNHYALFEETRKRLMAIIGNESFPDSDSTASKCGQCEYIKYCNDRF